MYTYSARSIPTLIRRSVLQAIAVAIIACFLLSLVCGFVYHYQQQRLHLQQLAELLATSASTADGASLVARQVSILLEDNSSIQSISFYSTDHPILTLDQALIEQESNNWYKALFADTVSFDRAVTSDYMNGITLQDSNSRQQLSSDLSSSAIKTNIINDKVPNSTALVGYINITLNVNKLRIDWFRKNIWLWLATMILSNGLIIFIIRKLNWPSKDITELAKVCEIVIDNSQLKQLPVIQQQFEFQELARIKLAFITLFNRLKTAEQKVNELAAFEQQLRNKDLSLDVQRNNFQSMITHELKTSLNAISGGLQLLDPQTLNEEQQDVLTIIRKGSQHLDNTLEQIIQLNKIEKGQIGVSLSDFNPLQLLAELLSEFEPIAKHKGIELIARIQHIDYTLEGDTNKIRQVISTLIDNAIKFTESGQVIVESQLTHFIESIRWEIKVIDTGIGIDTNYMEDIFTPFFQVDPSHTRDYEGVGVGLPVIKQIVQLIGATIKVSSELDMGSEFMVIMPLRNTYQNQQKLFSFVGLNIVYYHLEKTGFIVDELQCLGASVSCKQFGLSLTEQLTMSDVDMIMIAEDILPESAAQLARYIREQESTHRVLLIYWYPPHKAHTLNRFESGLKAVGVDFCHSATNDSKVLYSLLKEWLAWW
ncbi:HAMP domain-containing histidine kinase [Psychrobacter frigidicola]|uniref:histidine kinase n=1 Tax=Psychrobacter frigidicola TaxID=45611 RepID=A0A5C7A2T5_9GAMM|nr:HAMP domain-containing sensor histidine kinase [Psychrobacter frigidicola]TXD97681.1 HAMP domain-containing histidine kinase [Psychrobacter frigidicola]